MARKLNSEEEHLFAEALRKEKSSTDDVASEQFISRFGEKSDTRLQLTPELAAWLSENPLGPIIS